VRVHVESEKARAAHVAEIRILLVEGGHGESHLRQLALEDAEVGRIVGAGHETGEAFLRGVGNDIGIARRGEPLRRAEVAAVEVDHHLPRALRIV
jgi:hypothetical protein